MRTLPILVLFLLLCGAVPSTAANYYQLPNIKSPERSYGAIVQPRFYPGETDFAVKKFLQIAMRSAASSSSSFSVEGFLLYAAPRFAISIF